MSAKTKAFIITMGVFFATVVFLTYYSKQVFLKNLPVVEVAMPQRAEQLNSGRFAYSVPAAAIHFDMQTGQYYVLLLQEVSDILGDNYRPVATTVTLLYQDEETARIDGLVYVEPIILTDDPRVNAGGRVMVEEMPER